MRTISILPNKLYTRGRFDHYSRDEKVTDLRRKGVGVVVNLTSQADLDLTRIPGLEYIHHPMSDGRTVDVSRLFWIARHLAVRIGQGKKVLVHCRAGRNRTGLVSAATVALVTCLDGSDAVDLVQRRRKGSMGTNLGFERYMRGEFDHDRQLARAIGEWKDSHDIPATA